MGSSPYLQAFDRYVEAPAAEQAARWQAFEQTWPRHTAAEPQPRQRRPYHRRLEKRFVVEADGLTTHTEWHRSQGKGSHGHCPLNERWSLQGVLADGS